MQKPEDLAAWVLATQGGDWDLAKVQAAMNSGPDNKTVSLKQPLPIVIFYATAWVEEDGDVHFFDDIYGYDAEMDKVLAKWANSIRSAGAGGFLKVKAGDTLCDWCKPLA